MKKTVKSWLIIVIIAMSPVINLAQPPHPNSPNNSGGGNAPNTNGQVNVPVGGGAPIDGGFSVLLVLGAVYGTSKLYKMVIKKKAVKQENIAI